MTRASIQFDERQCTRLEIWIFAIMILLGVGSVGWFLATHPFIVASEAALRLDMATMLLAGKCPYIDFLDADPPVGVFLFAVPAFISSVLHSDLLATFTVCAMITQFFSLAICLWLIRQSELGKNEYVLALFAFAFVLISNIFVFQFGEHEQLLIWLATPYILRRWLRSQDIEVSKDLSCFFGIAAGLAFWQNLLYLCLPIVLEIVLLVECKKLIRPFFCPELVGLFIGMSFVPTFFMFSPEVSNMYFGSIIPVVIAGFQKIDHTVTYLYGSPDDRNTIYAAIGICMITQVIPRVNSLARIFYIFCLVGLALFIFEKNGASGQLILHEAGALFTAAIVFGVGLEQLNQRPKLRLLTVSILAIACAVMLYSMSKWYSWATEIADKIDPKEFKAYKIIDKYTQPGDQIMFVNDTICPGYPIVLVSKRKTTPPFLWGFQMRVLSENGDKKEPDKVLQACTRNLVNKGIGRSIKNREPKVIFMQMGRSEDLLRRNPKIVEALDGNYKPVDDVPVPLKEPTYTSGINYTYTIFVRRK